MIPDSPLAVDLNCDLGEGCPHDQELLSLVTTVNVACGYHAGDLEIAADTLREAAGCGVRAGAHPGFPDREHFGRREMVRSEKDVYQDCLYQIGALAALARHLGQGLSHVKPHGALYNQACASEEYARPIVRAALVFGLPVMGLPGSWLERACAGRCPFIPEGFADRRYLPGGTLVPRSSPDAMIHDPEEAARQALWLLRERGVRTLCVHGDNPQAVRFVVALREALTAQGARIEAFAASEHPPGR